MKSIGMSLLAFVWSTAVLAADNEPLSLTEAIDHALGESPDVTAREAAVEAAQAGAPSAGRLPDPELVTGVDNLPIDTADRFSFTRDFMTMRKIGVMQSFPNHEKRRLQSERAERGIGIAQAELRKTQFDAARAAAEAWIARAVAEESLARLRELKPETDLQAAAGRAALASGRASAAEALGTQTLVAGLEERILAFEQDAEMKRAELGRWIGAAAQRPLAAIPTDGQLEHSMESLVAAVPDHAPLAPLVAAIAAARTDVELARAERRPDWSTEVSYARRGPDFSNLVSLEFRVGLPIFAKYRQNPMIAEKLATVRAQEAMRDAEVRMHTAEVQATVAEWRRGRERLEHYTSDLVPLAHDRSRAALASYSAGRGDLRSAIDALTQEIDTQLNYVQLQGSVARAWVFLHLLHDSGTPK
jgi:cobalt-zinc-cadmium efflux system outer membrane protein